MILHYIIYMYHDNVSIMRQLSYFIDSNIHYNFNKFDFMKNYR